MHVLTQIWMLVDLGRPHDPLIEVLVIPVTQKEEVRLNHFCRAWHAWSSAPLMPSCRTGTSTVLKALCIKTEAWMLVVLVLVYDEMGTKIDQILQWVLKVFV